MNIVLLSIAFTSGILAFLSPCAAAMLPAYAGFFLSFQDSGESIQRDIIKGIKLGLMLAFGFATVFIALGTMLLILGNTIVFLLPWVSILIGMVLVLIALYELLGNDIPIAYIAKLQTFIGNTFHKNDKGIISCYIFGIMYALAALGCSFPVFLSVIFISFSEGRYIAGIFNMVAYLLGMSILAIGVSIGLAVSKSTIEKYLIYSRKYINMLGNIVILLAGMYLIYFSLISYFNIKIL